MSQIHYQEWLEGLRETKIRQTQQKHDRLGDMDEDDYGYVLPPEDFAWTPTPNHPDGSFYGLAAWAENFASLMDAYPLYIDPRDALAGRCRLFLKRQRKVQWLPECDYDHLKPLQKMYDIIPGIGNDAHFAGDLQIGLKLGWGGLLEKIETCRQRWADDAEKQAFYEAHVTVIHAVQRLMRRTVEEIRRQESVQDDRALRENLVEMAEVSEWLIENPPETLRQACQWIAWYKIASRTYNRDGAGGQLDRLLESYYQNDVKSGRLDREKAIYLLACLLLNDTQYYQLRGPDEHGQDMTSEMSFLILDAAHAIRIPCNLTIRCHDGLDPGLFELGMKYLLEDGLGYPRFSGDASLVEGFMRNGYSAELGRQRIAVGCNWMSLPGREYTMNDTMKINVAKVFDVAWREMVTETDAPGLTGLWERFDGHLQQAVRVAAEGIDWQLDHQYRNEPELFLNLLCYGPLDKGLDATHGGVEYYNMCIDGAGLATVADSFAALEYWIEQKKEMTWEEMAGHLRDDFAGIEGEAVRRRLHRGPRYGQVDSLGDVWAGKVSRVFTDRVKADPTPGGRNLIPGWFSWANTVELGQSVGATPDGRRAGEPISHGANPNPGASRVGGLTGLCQSIAAIQPGYGNTAPWQLELDPGLQNAPDAKEKIGCLIKTHSELGGTLVNINIVDAEKILAAHEDPSRYPDLVVRVTGFTAYFATLSKEFRQLVVDRLVTDGLLDSSSVGVRSVS